MTGWVLAGPTGAPKAGKPGTARLIAPRFPGLPDAGLPPTPAQFELLEGCLIVELPDWPAAASAPHHPAKPAKAAPSAPAARAPYRGVAASTGLGNGVGRPTASIFP